MTAALVLISLVIDPALWRAWLADDILKTADGGAPLDQFSIAIPLWLRLPAAALLVAWGGRTDRAWTVPVAATLGLPILWPTGFAILAALWPIAARRPGVTSPDVFGVRAATAAVDPAGASQ